MPIPYIDTKRALEAHDLRKKGLSISQIAKIMNSHKATVHRWLSDDVSKLSTGTRLRRSQVPV